MDNHPLLQEGPQHNNGIQSSPVQSIHKEKKQNDQQLLTRTMQAMQDKAMRSGLPLPRGLCPVVGLFAGRGVSIGSVVGRGSFTGLTYRAKHVGGQSTHQQPSLGPLPPEASHSYT